MSDPSLVIILYQIEPWASLSPCGVLFTDYDPVSNSRYFIFNLSLLDLVSALVFPEIWAYHLNYHSA